MREPKTPLPWIGVGEFADPRDRAYAVHAANALPEVLAALRKWVQIAEDAVRVHEKRHEPEQAYQWKLWRNDFRAALAKAEGG